MQKYLFLFCFALAVFSCKNIDNSKSVAPPEIQVIDYPNDLVKVFDNHGPLIHWQKMKSMSYEIVKEEGNELQKIDLQDRREHIKASTFESGYDGKNYWVVADSSYNSNPKFYTNLMFYFYAMPFVLADPGITYSKVAPLTFEGVDYPGYKISYDLGIGVSPEDEYFIYYDAATHEMAWLGYTVTFFSGKKSEKIKWIKYDDWKQVNGLKLPNSLSWYKTEEGKITELSKTRTFANVSVSEQKFSVEELAMPVEARVVE